MRSCTSLPFCITHKQGHAEEYPWRNQAPVQCELSKQKYFHHLLCHSQVCVPQCCQHIGCDVGLGVPRADRQSEMLPDLFFTCLLERFLPTIIPDGSSARAVLFPTRKLNQTDTYDTYLFV